MTIKQCPTHKTYKGTRKPRVPCWACVVIYYFNGKIPGTLEEILLMWARLGRP